MTMRGVQKPGASTRTSAFLGVLADDRDARMEFLTLVSGASGAGGR